MLYRLGRRDAARLALFLLIGFGLPAQSAVAARTTSEAPRSAQGDPAAAPAQSGASDSVNAAPLKANRFGLKVSGYVGTAFNRSNGATDNTIAGRLYERDNNQLSLNVLKFSVDRPFNASAVDVGFHTDLIFGQNAPVLKSAGFNLGRNADVYQLYGTLNLPTANGHGVQVKIGRMATFLGMELIEKPLNPDVSIANQFIL